MTSRDDPAPRQLDTTSKLAQLSLVSAPTITEGIIVLAIPSLDDSIV